LKEISQVKKKEWRVLILLSLIATSMTILPVFSGLKAAYAIGDENFWMESAKNAWSYFQPGVGISLTTGLNYANKDWHRITDWDLGAYLSALLAARKLGLLSDEGQWGFNDRIKKILGFLEKRPILEDGLPYAQYESDTGKMPIEIAKRAVHPSDFGRLLLALDDLRCLKPELDFKIRSILERYNIKKLAESEYFAGNSFYESYVAQGYWAFGFQTPKLKSLKDLGRGEFINIYDEKVPKAWITSEPLILIMLEGRGNESYKAYADTIFKLQKERYERTGVLTAFTEGAYLPPHYYVYEWIATGDGDTWIVWSNGKKVEGPEIVYTKVAYSYYALYKDEYSRKLVEHTMGLREDGGFLEGSSSDGSIIINSVTDKTNAMILEAAAYVVSIPKGSKASPLNEEVEEKVFKAFKAVAEAERKGGNVSSLVAELNSAIELAKEAESLKDESLMKEALAKLDEIALRALEVGEIGLAAARWKRISTGIALSIEASIALIVYVYAPQVFWRVWAKVKRKWKVKAIEKR
jgi:hypothetical protein